MKVCPNAAQVQSHVAQDFFQLVSFTARAILLSCGNGRADVASFERELRVLLHNIGTKLVQLLLENIGSDQDSIELDGELYKLVYRGTKTYLSLFGPVSVFHGLYRPRGRNRPTVSLLERRADIVRGYYTPGAARLALLTLVDSCQQDASRLCGEVGMPVSASSLGRLLRHCSSRWEENRLSHEEQVRSRCVSFSDNLPTSQPTTLCFFQDGAMVPMRKEKKGSGPAAVAEGAVKAPVVKAAVVKATKSAAGSGPKSLYREAGCGAVTLYDSEVTRLQAVYFGRMPEPRKETLTLQTRDEMLATMEMYPGLRRVFLCDGAGVNWRNASRTEQYLAQKALDLEQNCPETHFIVDFFHACKHLKAAADALYGEKSAKGSLFFEERKFWLQYFDGGVYQLIASLRHYMGRAKGGTKAKLREELNYFTNQADRMDYARNWGATL